MTRARELVVDHVVMPVMWLLVLVLLVWVCFGWLLIPLAINHFTGWTFWAWPLGISTWWLGVGVVLYFAES